MYRVIRSSPDHDDTVDEDVGGDGDTEDEKDERSDEVTQWFEENKKMSQSDERGASQQKMRGRLHIILIKTN
jgi:hypothetical protein